MSLSTYRECTSCGTSNTAASFVCVSCGAVLPEESVSSVHDDEHELSSRPMYSSGLSAQEPLQMQALPISLLDPATGMHVDVYDEMPACPASGGMQQQQQLFALQKMSAHVPAKRSLSRRKLLFGVAGVALAGSWLLAYQSSRPAQIAPVISRPPMLIPTSLGVANRLPVTEKFSLAWSPDGRYLGLASEDGILQIKDGTTYATLFDASSNVPGVNDASTAINDLVWSPTKNSGVFACACDDGTVQLRQAPQGTVSQLYREHTSPVQAVSWRQDGKYIASADQTPVVNIWDAASLNTLTSYGSDTFHGQVTSLSWSPDGTLLACASTDGSVSLLNSSKEQSPDLVYTGHQSPVEAVVWSPDGGYVASASDDGNVHIWSPQTGKPLVIYRAHSDKVYCLAWSPDSQFVASGSWDTTVCVWKLGDARPYQIFTQPQARVVSLAWSRQGHIVAVDATGTLFFLSLKS